MDIIECISNYRKISEEAKNEIERKIKIQKLQKGTVLHKEGLVANRLFYLRSGMARTFFYKKGKDITYWIYPEHSFLTAWSSYIKQIPSTENIEIIEDAELVSLTYDEWQELYTKFPELESFSRILIEEIFASLDIFYQGYYILTAKEKYDLLLEYYPDFVLKTNLGYIASMLGISQETLSRIRSK
ncbi:Crp/Fnr family transcriptional regulator [Aureivirga sp. CE67]|uniref:Crp/Fnr family transcriptional regulator n=1 Tax=Aureivirga sp. CE67 TaxID=1788983 RepID=UPI0018CAA58D|nr:Crp/Fnr family transcriptional regulator [Aureivirga sp. CE67]